MRAVRREPSARPVRPSGLAGALLATGLVAAAWSGPSLAGVRAVVASGLGGTPEYDEAFRRDAATIGAALASLDPDPDAVAVLEAPTREALLEALEARVDAAAAGVGADAGGTGGTGGTGYAGTGDVLALVLVGHGTLDADGYRFNVPGPDVTAADLVGALATSGAEAEVVVVATSASGALLDVLTQPGRVVATATKSGGELNAVRFAEHFADALDGADADVDRNEILTLGEAFRHADAATRRWYEERNLLAPEHARLAGEGADALALARLGSLAAAGDDPVVAALLDERSTIEAEFAALRGRKDELAAADYWDALEALLLRIARLQVSIDEATGWSEGDA